MLRAEYRLNARRDYPCPLVFLALIASDGVEGLGARAPIVGRGIRIIVASLRIRVLERDAVGERAVGRAQGESGVSQNLAVLVVFIVVAEVARGRVVAVEVGARLRVVAA